MPKSPALEQKSFARAELISSAGVSKVGNFIEVVLEDKDVATFLFENNQKGYVGWRWSVSVFQAKKDQPATISEIVLVPGDSSLVAPDWVPWSERLSDYKALQIEIERQAALDSETSDVESSDSDAVDLSDELIAEKLADSKLEDKNPELAFADLEVGEDSEDDSENTGRKPPRFLRRRKGLKVKKARGQGKNPKDETN